MGFVRESVWCGARGKLSGADGNGRRAGRGLPHTTGALCREEGAGSPRHAPTVRRRALPHMLLAADPVGAVPNPPAADHTCCSLQLLLCCHAARNGCRHQRRASLCTAATCGEAVSPLPAPAFPPPQPRHPVGRQPPPAATCWPPVTAVPRAAGLLTRGLLPVPVEGLRRWEGRRENRAERRGCRRRLGVRARSTDWAPVWWQRWQQRRRWQEQRRQQPRWPRSQ